MSSDTHLLPGITSVINMADSAEKDSFVSLVNVKEEPNDLPDGLDSQEKVVCISVCAAQVVASHPLFFLCIPSLVDIYCLNEQKDLDI
jgi:hypothetical protein